MAATPEAGFPQIAEIDAQSGWAAVVRKVCCICWNHAEYAGAGAPFWRRSRRRRFYRVLTDFGTSETLRRLEA